MTRAGHSGGMNEIRAAVGGICACLSYRENFISLPTGIGAQLSMTGDIIARGCTAELDRKRLLACLSSFRGTKALGREEYEKISERRRFMLLCGELDRTVAIIGALKELFNAGENRIIICTELPDERDSLAESLDAFSDSFGVSSYKPGRYDFGAKYNLSASVYSFITSASREVLVVGRDCVSKKTNLIRQRDRAGQSFTGLIARLHPTVITSSRKIAAGRSIAASCRIFEPSATFVFCEEVRRLRDAVIYFPGDKKTEHRTEKDIPEQLSF